ncbi:MAG: preprotein translocase subunit YajC [Mycoplasmatales bacterium]
MEVFIPFAISLIFLVLFFQFLIIRPQKKQQQMKTTMINAVNVGDSIETTAGIVGTVLKVNEDTFEILTLDAKIELKKYAIIKIISHIEDSKGE